MVRELGAIAPLNLGQLVIVGYIRRSLDDPTRDVHHRSPRVGMDAFAQALNRRNGEADLFMRLSDRRVDVGLPRLDLSGGELPGKLALLDAAIREAHEEVGL